MMLPFGRLVSLETIVGTFSRAKAKKKREKEKKVRPEIWALNFYFKTSFCKGLVFGHCIYLSYCILHILNGNSWRCFYEYIIWGGPHLKVHGQNRWDELARLLTMVIILICSMS